MDDEFPSVRALRVTNLEWDDPSRDGVLWAGAAGYFVDVEYCCHQRREDCPVLDIEDPMLTVMSITPMHCHIF